MVKERPILFSGAMVRAILEGRKTQTRRALNRNKLYNGFAFDDPRIARACPYGQPGDRLWVRETWHLWGPPEHQILAYRADYEDPDSYTWRPSIFMPRGYSRLMLEVVGARVERVQDISETDAIAEGMQSPGIPAATTNRAAFARLWDEINGARGYGWEANPWVWVVEFKKVRP